MLVFIADLQRKFLCTFLGNLMLCIDLVKISCEKYLFWSTFRSIYLSHWLKAMEKVFFYEDDEVMKQIF